jgi:hypothetical protein
VIFGPDQDYEYRVHESEIAGVPREDSEQWMEQEYVSLGCEPTNPVGKVLLTDRLLGVARAMGASPFAAQNDWARTFARHAVNLAGRSNVTINIPDATVGL